MSIPRLLPKPPRTQALASKTFSPPPLDATLTLPELYEWHLKNNQDHPLFVFSRSNNSVRTILWPEAVRAVHTGARIVRNVMHWKPGMHDVPVVALLAASDGITYFTMMMAVMRAGYIVFPISPRNSAPAVAHLISKVTVKHVFVGRDQSMINLANEAVEILDSQYSNIAKPNFTPIPLFEDLFLDSSEDPDDIPYEKRGQDDFVIYLHSSGSTAFPKPIPWTNYRFSELALIPYFGERDLTGAVFSLHSMPMYHGMGILQLCWTASSGLIISAFEPRSPATLPTPQSHFEAAVATNSDIIFCVPAVIEEWSRKPDYVKWLATRDGVLFGGGPLNKTVGDYLTSQGVSIFILYGSSEGGIMSPILPAEVGYDWDYFRWPGNVLPEMVPYGNGTYEFVMVENPFCRPSVINTKINGIDSYATSDLFTEHPTKKGYWRVYGRTDDQIMHNTGEKTNPGPLENMLNQDPHVQSSVMFGRGKFQAGVIIDPKAEFKFDLEDEAKLAEFRNKIWPTVQRMNAFAPQHSRLFKEMIIVCKPSKPFQYTAKNTARRQAIINDYEEEIENLYNAVADSTQSSIPPPVQWDSLTTLEFVRSVVNKVLEHDVKDNIDIFQHGCDSLQATWIRNTLLRALRDSAEIDTRQLVDNFVYDHPTVVSMASFLSSLASGTSSGTENSTTLKVEKMRKLVEKYSSDFPVHNVPENGHGTQTGDVVLVTGTTGALGSYLLAELVHNPAISKIYAINRPRPNDPSSLLERQEKSLVHRGLNANTLLSSDKVVLVEANIAISRFGLNDKTYDEMLSSVTHIIHNAWPVDFNLSLGSFETSIKGLRNLIDFAIASPLATPPSLVYTSSIGVFQDTESVHSSVLPELPIAPEVAVGTGYTESKWVSEEILRSASRTGKLNAVIARVGQLCGGLNGSWNTAEWFPSMVESAQTLGCLPDDERVVDWIPVHIAAKALVDYRSSASTSIVHLIHPKPIAWSTIARIIAADLSVELVSYSEWFARLERAGTRNDGSGQMEVEALRNLPALRLLQFFRSTAAKFQNSTNALGFARLASDEAVRLSKSLSDSSTTLELGESDVKSWLKYWRQVSFIKSA